MNSVGNKKSEIFADARGANKVSNEMKVLIGTAINVEHDYAMEGWLKNVATLEYPADLLLVDSSTDFSYMEIVKGYLKKYDIKNCELIHIDIPQFQPMAEKTGRSWEVIRQKVLTGGYDAWFSWSSDRIIPTDTLNKLMDIMRAGNYTMVHPNSESRSNSFEPNVDFGVCLIGRWCLERYGFSLDEPGMPDCWAQSETWFKKQVLKGGGSYIELYGVIGPVLKIDNK